jgi:cytoskeletal protein CcmA (bactofilin family)
LASTGTIRATVDSSGLSVTGDVTATGDLTVTGGATITGDSTVQGLAVNGNLVCGAIAYIPSIRTDMDGAATHGSQVDRFPIYDGAGTLIGYVAVYAA